MSNYKQREKRTPTRIEARVKTDYGWSNAQIRNVSSGGMLLQAVPPPPLGTYIEVCRGDFSIVGRVRWIGSDRFGIQALENVDLGHLQSPKPPTAWCTADRRKRPRVRAAVAKTTTDNCFAAAQWLGRRLEFVALVTVGMTLALALTHAAASLFSAPLDSARVALTLPQP